MVVKVGTCLSVVIRLLTDLGRSLVVTISNAIVNVKVVLMKALR